MGVPIRPEARVLFHDPYHWFPSMYFATALAVAVFAAFFVDFAVPARLALRRPNGPVLVRDRDSYMLMQLVGVAAVALAVECRFLDWAVAPPAVQYGGLLLIVSATVLREWAIVRLGRYFSRIVQIEVGHRLVTDGPYRRLRHPAYTGMVLVYVGIGLALGTWLGAAIALALMLGATLYRISVEEEVLIAAFGREYCEYRRHTWRLFPGW
jgi:protein-S-isoprenylcysteine O-methyltransferase Ste14